LEHPNVQHFFLPGQSLSTLQSSWDNIGGQPIFDFEFLGHLPIRGGRAKIRS
jgi:hypothetical protein